MSSPHILFFIALVPSLFAGEDRFTPDDWSRRDFDFFSSNASENMESALGYIQRLDPPEEYMDEVLDRISRNESYRLWVYQFFADQPVTFENKPTRSNTLWVLKHLRAEWAVRFLMELGNDQRPMTSSKYDYDSPEFVAMLKAMVDENPEAALDFAISSGYHHRRTNAQMASSSLYDMKLAGAPTRHPQGLKEEPTVIEWLRLPDQRNRIPEIVRATWGKKAVLNVDLGLGPDNKPLSEGDTRRHAQRERFALRDRYGSGPRQENAETPKELPWIPLCGALLALATAGFYLTVRKRLHV